MSAQKKIKRRRVNRIFWAAKTALSEPGGVRLVEWIGRGPSIRARARLALAAAFFVAAPILFIGVLSTSNIAEYTSKFGDYDKFLHQARAVLLRAYEVQTDISHLLTQYDIEVERALRNNYSLLTRDIENLTANHPPAFNYLIDSQILVLGDRVKFYIEQSLAADEHAKITQLSLARRFLRTLIDDLHALDSALASHSVRQIELVQKGLAEVGRNQLVLFLVLLFAIPIFIGLVPRWLVAPIYRLKGLARRIEEGRLREISVAGRDEVSLLTRSLKRALLWRESLEQKKSAKIFELRNVLRTVLTNASDCILIIDSEHRINYTNKAMATLIGTEPHSLEGDKLKNFVIAPELFAAIGRAMNGDVTATPFIANFELSSGKVFSLQVLVGAVHDRDGSISRVVVVMQPH